MNYEVASFMGTNLFHPCSYSVDTYFMN